MRTHSYAVFSQHRQWRRQTEVLPSHLRYRSLFVGFTNMVVCLCILSLLSSTPLQAQHQPVSIPNFTQTPQPHLLPSIPISRNAQRIWKTDDGLPQNSVTALCQTRDGYMWIGTEEGLTRFDGVKFVTFNKATTPAFKNNWVNELLEIRHSDGTSTLWIGTLGGLIRLEKGVFTCFTTKDGLPSNILVCLAEASNGALWIATRDGGISCFEHGTFTNFTEANGFPSNGTHGIAVGRDGTVWVGLDGKGLLRMKKDAASKISTKNFSTKLYTSNDGLSSNNVWRVLVDTSNPAHDVVWAATNGGGVSRLENGVMTTFSSKDGLQNPIVSSLWRDGAGAMWFGTWGGGVSRLANGIITSFTTKEGLSHNVVYSLVGDREGALWIGTQGGGVTRLHTSSFTTYTTLDGLVGDFAVSFAQSEKRVNRTSADSALWMGTYNGLSRFDGKTFTNYTTKNGLPSNNVHSLWQDSSGGASNGALWVGTWGGGLSRFLQGKWTTFSTQNGLLNNIVTAIKPDVRTANGLWIGTWGGVNYLENGVLTRSITAKEGLPLNYVFSLLPDKYAHALWVGTWGGGLGRINLDNGTVTVFNDTNGLANMFIRAIVQDRDSVVWVGTVGGGLHRYSHGKWTIVNTSHGLFDNNVWSILEDDNGWMWMSCNRGVFRVRKADLTAFAEGRITHFTSQSFGKADGMKNPECNSGFLKSFDGKLYYPTMQGVAMVQPSELFTNHVPPPVIIESILTESIRARYGTLWQGDSLQSLTNTSAAAHFSPQTEKFEFHYTATSLLYPEKVQCKYMLEGYDKTWVDAASRRVAYYTNLPRGRTYRFRVIAANNDGVWNEAGATAEFSVDAYFWETWWFTALGCVCVIGTGFGAYRARTRHLKRRAEALKTLVRERTSELSDANDEIQRQLDIQAEQAREIELANAHLNESNIQLDRMIADLQSMQMQLVASERVAAVGMLTAGVMHEINNPNAAIHAALEQMRIKSHTVQNLLSSLVDEESKTLPEVQKLFTMLGEIEGMNTIALDGAQRVKHIVASLRNFTKHQEDGLKTAFLEQELTATVEMFRYQFKNVRVELDFEPDLSIKVHLGEINQVFLNLLVNAAQAGASEIMLQARSASSQEHQQSSGIQVQIRDNGQGIAPEILPRIFEPFYTTKDAANSGLGLSISKKIIEQHGGRIEVSSALGRGTVFTLFFPV
ncbi:MAG: hypothetical protein EAZ92_13775 [Candidatus Kapaibacterium sp.]|nr:MAG: hypothetical protein EAZ92_13775 [Candidatus Kapabacteria bacterium]